MYIYLIIWRCWTRQYDILKVVIMYVLGKRWLYKSMVFGVNIEYTVNNWVLSPFLQHVCLSNCKEHLLMLSFGRLQVFKSFIFSGHVLLWPEFCMIILPGLSGIVHNFPEKSSEHDCKKCALSNMLRVIRWKDTRKVRANFLYCLAIILCRKWMSRTEKFLKHTPFIVYFFYKI